MDEPWIWWNGRTTGMTGWVTGWDPHYMTKQPDYSRTTKYVMYYVGVVPPSGRALEMREQLKLMMMHWGFGFLLHMTERQFLHDAWLKVLSITSHFRSEPLTYITRN